MGIKDRAHNLLRRLQGTEDIHKKEDIAGHAVSSSSRSDDMKRGAKRSEAEECSSKSRKIMKPTHSDHDNIPHREDITAQGADSIAAPLPQMPAESKLHPTRRGISQVSFSHCLRSLPAELQMQILPDCLKKFCITINPGEIRTLPTGNQVLGSSKIYDHWATYAKIQAEHGLDIALCRAVFYSKNPFTLNYTQTVAAEECKQAFEVSHTRDIPKHIDPGTKTASWNFRRWLRDVEDVAEKDGADPGAYVTKIGFVRFCWKSLRVLVEVVRGGNMGGLKLVGTVNGNAENKLDDLEGLKERFGRELVSIGESGTGQGGLGREQWEEVESLVVRLFHVPRSPKDDDSE